MRFSNLLRFASLLVLLVTAFGSVAQTAGKENLRQPRILLIVDASSSMLQPWNGNTSRFKAAGQLVVRLMDSIYAVNPAVEFGLRVYGHQSPAQNNDCFDSRQEVLFSKNNVTQMDLRLSSIRPFGVSPIAYSLEEAANNDLVDEVHNAYSIILITDGGESCGGDICQVMRELIDRKIFFKPYILSMVDYAPLRKVYECFGRYLQVAKPDDIPNAIHNIVEAYRPALSAPIMVTKLDTVPTPKVRILTVTKTPLPKPNESVPVIDALRYYILPQGRPIRYTPAWNYTFRKVHLPFIAAEKEQVASLNPESGPKTLPAQKINTAHSVGAINPNVAIKLPDIPAEKKDTATRTKVTITTLPPVATSTKAVTPVRPATPKPTEVTYTRETEDAKETSLAILFTNGHGKFYSTTPKLQLLDAATGKLVKEFYRTVDAAGNPDPQVIPAGTYNLRVAGQTNLLMRRVLVEANKKNKLIVKVSNGSLRFEYYNSPGRPITEYEALVNIRFEPGPTIHQRCTAELEYPPGNYYIEVNTMPITRFNVDIDFGATSVVYLPEPGFVQFTNTTPKGKVMLYAPLGNQFVRFVDLNITGNPASQKLRLKPGAYEAHWVKHPELPYQTETIEHFNVKSNSLTTIELH